MPRTRLPLARLLGVLALALAVDSARAQDLLQDLKDPTRAPLLPRFTDLAGSATATTSNSVTAPAARIRLFRFQPGFLNDPVGLNTDNDLFTPPGTPSAASDLDYRVNVSLSTDNPAFDFRRPGDPGGPGFYKLNSQWQLFDTGSTGLSIGMQATSPAGLENEGLSDGPTVLSPGLGVFHALDDGTAFQGFINKNVRANSQWRDNLDRSIQYGLAVQRPVTLLGADANQGMYLFLEALGRYRYDGDPNQTQPRVWELVPGLHWRMSDTVWMSGGVLVPLRPSGPTASNMWQITCSWQF
jgi:hypothetical protein